MPIMADEIERRRTADNLECDVTSRAVVTKTFFRFTGLPGPFRTPFSKNFDGLVFLRILISMKPRSVAKNLESDRVRRNDRGWPHWALVSRTAVRVCTDYNVFLISRVFLARTFSRALNR